MQIIKIDIAETVPPGFVSAVGPDGVELWREPYGRKAFDDLPSGATLWVAPEDFYGLIAAGVPKHALN